MTIYISDSTPQQPAFLYATYPAAVAIVASGSAAGYYPEDMLQADENNGWRPDSVDPATITVDLLSPTLTEFLALAGIALDGIVYSLLGSNDNIEYTDILVDAVISTTTGAHWARYASATYRYLRLSIQGHSNTSQIKHLVFGALAPLPFLEDGFCANPLQADGQHLVSHAGLFLGSITNKVTRPFSLGFGQVTQVEEVAFSNWVEACIRTAQAYFFVPDLGQPLCYFGYTEKNFKYEPTMKVGLLTIPRIPFTSRVS